MVGKFMIFIWFKTKKTGKLLTDNAAWVGFDEIVPTPALIGLEIVLLTIIHTDSDGQRIRSIQRRRVEVLSQYNRKHPRHFFFGSVPITCDGLFDPLR